MPDHSKFKSKHLHLNPLSSTERVGCHVLMFAALEIFLKNYFVEMCTPSAF